MGEIEVQVCSLRLTGAVREAASLPGAADLRVCLWYGVFDVRKIRCCPARAPGMHPDLSAGFAGPVTALGSVLLPRHKHTHSGSAVGVREPGRAGISHVCLVHLTRPTDQ